MGDPNSSKSIDQVKKNVRKIILQVNSDILELQNERTTGAATATVKQSIENSQQNLVKSLQSLKEKPGFIVKNQLQKMVSMIETNIETIRRVLREDETAVSEEEIEKNKEEASKAFNEGDTVDVIPEKEVVILISEMVENYVDNKNEVQDDTSNNVIELKDDGIDKAIEAELNGISKYKSLMNSLMNIWWSLDAWMKRKGWKLRF